MNVKFKKDTYVDEAESVILNLRDVNFKVGRDELTSTQLRNLLAMTSTIYNIVINQGVKAIEERLAYLRIQFIYQSGRNQAVKKLVDEAEILDILFGIQSEMEDNDEKKEREDVIRFCHYMEALVAYLKYYNE